MDYLLTEEQKMLKEMVANFSRAKIKPVAGEHDEKKIFPAELIKELSALGLLAVAYPEEYGGAGMDNVCYFIAMEGISRHCAATAVIISVHTLCIDLIHRFGNKRQKKKYLPDLCAGRKLGCFCLTESQAGSDAAALKTSAKRQGDNWVLNGTKQFITNAAQADIAIVFASTDPAAHKDGITAFIVEKDTSGYHVGKLEDKLGVRASSTAEIILDDCIIPEEYQLGELNKGFKIALGGLSGSRIGIAGQALGIARGAIEDSVSYAKERVQFGRPIAEFQGIKWYLAQMQTEYEAAWLLTYRAARMEDLKLPCVMEASIAKLKASEVAEFCTSKAIQIHGGYGYIKEFDVERYFRDARVTQIYEGTSEIQREVIAKYMLK
ncbi:MAG: acyl-CoA dehydrogenase [Phycisphaerae bacterium SM23_30]|nr:MAG: acyl-CoA dehydrogenase [Phycisphaerae bacterium SM23_30]